MTQPFPVKYIAGTTGTRRRFSARRLLCGALAIALFGADALARDSAGLESGGGLAAMIHGETQLPATFFQPRSFRSVLAIEPSQSASFGKTLFDSTPSFQPTPSETGGPLSFQLGEDKEMHQAPEPNEDDPNRLGNFPRNLGRSFRSLFSRESILPAAITVGTTGIALALDDEVQDYFGDGSRFESVEEIGETAGNELVLAATYGGLFVAGQLSKNERFRSMTNALAQGGVWTNLFTAGYYKDESSQWAVTHSAPRYLNKVGSMPAPGGTQQKETEP